MKKNTQNSMRVFAITLVFAVTLSGLVSAQNLGWAKQLGGPDYEHGRSIAVDNSGNVYTAGEFRGTADFDPGPGTYNLTSFSPCCYDIFISKLDASGNFLWAKQLGGTDIDIAFAITVDAAGNVYTTGEFYGTADFEPGPGVYNLTSAGSSDIFISKLDAAGNFVWAEQMGGPANSAASLDHPSAIAVDAAGNVYTTGNFAGTSDFDPGPGVYNLTSNYTFQDDIFISKIDVNGNFVWAKQLSGISNEESVSIAVDAAGNVYTTGQFYNTTDFDPGPGIYNLTPVDESNYQNYDVFISKLDAAGDFVWAKQLGGPHVTGSSFTDNAYGIAVDASGNVYTTGSFPGTADFDPGPAVYNLTALGGVDVFISKLNANGDFVWVKQLESISVVKSYAIALDAGGNVYTTGYFTATTDFDPSPATYNLSPAGGGPAADIFVSKLSSSGNFIWVIQMGGISGEYGLSVAVNAVGNVYTTGYFANTADFDPGPGINNLTAFGADDIFIVELIGNSPLPIKLMNFAVNATNKNSVDISWATATETNNSYFTVERSKDGLSFELVTTVKGAINSSIPIQYQAVDKTPFPGISYYRLKQTDLDGKFIYSAIKSVKFADNKSVSLYPNPAKKGDMLQLITRNSKVDKIEIINTSGQLLYSSSPTQTGSINILLPASLASGEYIVRVITGNKVETQKLQIQ